MVGFYSFASLLAASLVCAIPCCTQDAGSSSPSHFDKRATAADDKLVFCHFMMGIVSGRTGPSDYDADMQLAKQMGIDAFALNIGTNNFTETQLNYAYASAANNDMRVFISFDFNWFNPATDAHIVGRMIANYSTQPAQLTINGAAFASSFSGDGLDVAAVRDAAGVAIFFAPNFDPIKTTDPSATVEAALNWMGWNNDGYNKAPTKESATITVLDGDHRYRKWLATTRSAVRSSLMMRSELKYIAPVSPWFSTHYGAEVSYSKNFVFPSDLLWFERWNQILTLAPHYVEIITWNDYGESHYIGPLSSPHCDDGASKWVNDMPHDGFRDMAKPYIAAFKAGATSVDKYITQDQLIYWYRPTLRNAECDATDNTMAPANNDSGNYFHGKPNGYEDMQDAVFVVALLTAAGTVTIHSGGTSQTFDGVAGANAFQVPMGVGKQSFSLTRNSVTILSGTSLKDIQNQCICGIYNFNAYVGTLPPGPADPLGADGLASFTAGLTATTCSATASLGTPTGAAASATAASSRLASAPRNPAPTAAQQTTATPRRSPGPTPTPPPPAAPSPTAQAQAQAQAQAPGCNAGAAAARAGPSAANLAGLCAFACAHGHCPAPHCRCTATGAAQTYVAGPAATGCAVAGAEAPAVSDDLCAFTCARGYCPGAACATTGC